MVVNRKQVIVTDKRAQRVATDDRKLQYRYLGFDAPFIYMNLIERIGCTDTGPVVNVVVKRTIFPTMALYINNQLVDIQRQKVGAQGDLARFIVEGGPWFNGVGVGPLASPGASLSWSSF